MKLISHVHIVPELRNGEVLPSLLQSSSPSEASSQLTAGIKTRSDFLFNDKELYKEF
jgi:hypothetical protein